MKRFTKKLVAALLSGAMVLGMSITSFAAEGTTPISVKGTDPGASVNVTKTWNVAENGLFNNTENFDFTLTYKDATPVGSNATATPQYNKSDMTSKDVDITTDWADNAAGGTSSTGTLSYVNLFDGVTFSAPGEYIFTLSENAGTNPNISYDESVYTITVQVVWGENDNLVIGGIVTSDQSGKKDGDGAGFTNNAKDTGALKITKHVSGNAANKTDEFTFSIRITGVNGTYTTTDGTVTAVDGTITKVITLSHGEDFVINNLPVGAEYTVTETGYGDYTSTSINGSVDEDRVITDTVKKGDNTVDYTNMKSVTAPTGIFLNFVPFILIFGAAVLGCFVFFRRRRTW